MASVFATAVPLLFMDPKDSFLSFLVLNFICRKRKKKNFKTPGKKKESKNARVRTLLRYVWVRGVLYNTDASPSSSTLLFYYYYRQVFHDLSLD